MTLAVSPQGGPPVLKGSLQSSDAVAVPYSLISLSCFYDPRAPALSSAPWLCMLGIRGIPDETRTLVIELTVTPTVSPRFP
jgi:hypothetical protein